MLGDLIGWRKITVGDHDWRVVWRVTHDEADVTIVDVAEVWAAGARSNSEVYAEMSAGSRRCLHLRESTHWRRSSSSSPPPSGWHPWAEPTARQSHLRPWLRTSLIEKVGLSAAAVDELIFDDAIARWNA